MVTSDRWAPGAAHLADLMQRMRMLAVEVMDRGAY
jgi:hypothetical protein